jgi:hypothetical protein
MVCSMRMHVCMYIYVHPYLCIHVGLCVEKRKPFSSWLLSCLGYLQSSPSLDRMTSLVSQVTDCAAPAGATSCIGCEAGKYSPLEGVL